MATADVFDEVSLFQFRNLVLGRDQRDGLADDLTWRSQVGWKRLRRESRRRAGGLAIEISLASLETNRYECYRRKTKPIFPKSLLGNGQV